MRIAYLTPLPPVRSGIASYSAMLLPFLREVAEVTVVINQGGAVDAEGALTLSDFLLRMPEFDVYVCQLGNNPHHEWIYRFAMEHPSIVVLHDAVLHHLVVEMTLARGDAAGYIEAMRLNHGAAGEAWARGRVFGLHDELGNFLFPASIELARRSRAVIVHNSSAGELLRLHGVATPVHQVNHLFVEAADEGPAGSPHSGRQAAGALTRDATREAFGFEDSHHVVGMFGFVTAAKRPEVVFEAFAAARSHDSALRLLIVGEPAPNVDLVAMARRWGIPDNAWRATGYVSDEEFDAHLAAVDRVVNLRYPTAGETSGAVLHILAAGKPMAVSAIGSFNDLPPSVARHVSLDDEEIPRLVEFLLDRAPHDGSVQRKWLMEYGDPSRAAREYAAICAATPVRILLPSPAASAFFPEVVATGTLRQSRLELVVTNGGAQPILSTAFGEPAFRVVIKWHHAGQELGSEWLTLPATLQPGASASLNVAAPGRATKVTLHAALEGVESVANEILGVIEAS